VTLFCYGSLVFAEVMRAVTGRSFPHEPARLFGWRRTRFRGLSFPGIQPHGEGSTSGTLWRGIDTRSAQLLDAYETAAYERIALPVRTSAGEVRADVYVVRPEARHLLSQAPWTPEAFARDSLAEFLRALRRR
jgi:gamma-glutamylcyclotransferase (GGCT)/AIG2-like uncharacterized protein YtfP